MQSHFHLPLRGWLALAVGGWAVLAGLVHAEPLDARLYARRTQIVAGHGVETTNRWPASRGNPVLPPGTIATPLILLDNNVNPASLGKGDWIWEMPQTETALGVTNVQQVMAYEQSLGMQWITVKCGDGGSIWSQFNSQLIAQAHAAGLKIFGWAYSYGNNSGVYGSGSSQTANINGEINVALNALNLGADGFIIDAEIEYETNATRRADATLYARSIKANYPTRFLAHAPFPYINYHSGFPYLEFGTNCDAVMPQDYWGAFAITPYKMVTDMNSQWITWQNSLTGFNTNAIKPIVPLGQSYSPVTGVQITQFLNCLQTNTPKASPAGYGGVSFWDVQSRTTDMASAIAGWNFNGITNLPPALTAAPVLNPVVDAGTNVTFTAAATGSTPLAWQWRFNGQPLAGATNASLTLTQVQTNYTGNYTVTVTNAFGSATSSAIGFLVYPVQTTVFADTFETNSAASWLVNPSSSDTAIGFAYDYSQLGIPAAPHSAPGTTKGVQIKANLTLGVVSALTMSPVNQSFPGDYRLHFDGWINVNGPFPAGGASSTEFMIAGLGTAGNRTEWNGPGATADGYYFSADGDGGVSSTSTTSGDYCAYAGTNLVSYTTGGYVAGTTTTARSHGSAYYLAAWPAGASAPAREKTLYAQQTGALNAGTLGLGWHDFLVSRRGRTVDWAVDGWRIATISNATFTASNICLGFWDPFASLTDNTNLSFGLLDNLRVEVPAVPPLITRQPADVAVKVAGAATFSVTANGLPAPACQWYFNSQAIPGATNGIYTLASVATNAAGNYLVICTNVAGTATSVSVTLTLLPSAPAWFQSVIEQPNQTLQLTATGDPGGYYYLENSTDLFQWSPVATLIATNGQWQWTSGAVTNDGQRFFRARSGP